MIKNLVFDCGQVLFRFDPVHFTEIYVNDSEDAKMLEDVIFSRKYWDRLDAGTITDNELKEKCRAELPERLHQKIDLIYDNWIDNLEPVRGMEDLVREARIKYGFRIFLLSDISRGFAERAHEIGIFRYFDGFVFSACCGMTKPDPRIFAYLCKENGIIPEETLFIDDKKSNTDAAEKCGIRGYTFDGDTEKLRKYISLLSE